MPQISDRLSPHFTLGELIASATARARNIENIPDFDEVEQLAALAIETLEPIRTLCGNHPVYISSGYRSPDLNKAVGGAPKSAHLFGCAADFTIPGFGPAEMVARAIAPHLAELDIDQLILSRGGGGSWVHVGRAIPPSTTPRLMVFTVAEGRTISGLA